MQPRRMGVVPVVAVITIIVIVIRTGTPVAGPPRTPSITTRGRRRQEQLLERCPSRWIRCDSLNGYKGRVATAKEEERERDKEDLAVIL